MPRGAMRLLLGLAGALALLAGAALCRGVARPPAREAEAVAHPEVLVVVNGESDLSRAIGEHYRRRRGVPRGQLLALSLPLHDSSLGDPRDETVGRADFVRLIRDPLERFLIEEDLAERIEIVVLVQGVPLRVGAACPEDPSYPRACASASVDAELALLFSGLDGRPGLEGMRNPYFDSGVPFGEWRAAHPGAPLRYLVARLAGYPAPLDPASGLPADVAALLEAARAEGAPRTYLVDEDPRQPPGRAAGNRVLGAAAAALAAAGLPVLHERSDAFAADVDGIAGYASWGSNDRGAPGAPYYGWIDGRLYPGRFGPRAVAVDVVSWSARSFTSPPRYGQSLAADLVRLGAAGVAGHVFEPLLGGAVRPDVLLRHYAGGARAGEAFWRAVPYLGWMNVYVGDPLMRSVLVAPAPRDRDGDGVPDGADDCLALPDPEQRDSDGDGYGNPCDGDVDNDGLVTTSWGVVPPGGPAGDLEQIALSAERGRYDPHHDLDGDGRVDEADLSLASLQLFGPPGPSGRAP